MTLTWRKIQNFVLLNFNKHTTMNKRIEETIDFLYSLLTVRNTLHVDAVENRAKMIYAFVEKLKIQEDEENYPEVILNFYFKGNQCCSFKKRVPKMQLDLIQQGLFLVGELPIHFSATEKPQEYFDEHAAKIVGVAQNREGTFVLNAKVSDGRKSNRLFHSFLIIQELGSSCFNLGIGFNRDKEQKGFHVLLSFDFIPATPKEINA